MKKEIKNIGFINSDLLSSFIIDGDKGFLYLFNYGNYRRISNFFIELKNDDNFQDIEDWLSDIFRDYDLNLKPNVINVESLNKELINIDILNDYPEEGIGNEIIKYTINLIGSN